MRLLLGRAFSQKHHDVLMLLAFSLSPSQVGARPSSCRFCFLDLARVTGYHTGVILFVCHDATPSRSQSDAIAAQFGAEETSLSCDQWC